LNYALKTTLNTVIDQKGSLVASDKLRFDFSHKQGLTLQELSQIEKICSEMIESNLTVYYKDVSLTIAKSIRGLRAVFGEVYPDPVRVVCIGVSIDDLMKNPDNSEWENYSTEFCGGTHVKKTNEMKRFIITEEGSIAKGIRRIVAVTGEQAFLLSKRANEWKLRLEELEKSINSIDFESSLKSAANDLDKSILPLVNKLELKAKLTEIKKSFLEAQRIRKNEQLKIVTDILKDYFEKNPDVKYYVGKFDNGLNGTFTQVLKNYKGTGKSLLLVSVDESGKVWHHCSVDKEFSKIFPANKWDQIFADEVGGRFGGKEDSAQGCGDKPEQVDSALKLVQEFAKLNLK
jgi:alanyl-tRNA synthetase